MVALLLAGASALTAVALLATWARYELVDSTAFSTTSTELLKDGTIRDQVARYLVAEVDRGDLSATQRRELRRSVANVLDTDKARRTWGVATQNAHAQLVGLIGDPNAQAAVLDLRPLIRAVARELNLPDPTAGLSTGSGRITILSGQELRDVRRVADSLQRSATGLLIATALMIALAIALASGWRRGAVAGAAVAVAIGAAVVLLARTLVGNHVVDVLVPAGGTREAGHRAWSISTSPLATFAIVALVAAAIALAAAALARRPGPSPLGPRRR